MSVQIVSKSQMAYQYIHKLILDGTYRPGQRIIVDQIVGQVNLSASPIREAIRKLESEGYLINKPYCGVVVASMELSQSFDRMQVLGILDSSAAGLSAPNLSSEEIKDLININDLLADCLNSNRYQHAGKLDREFHNLLNSCCKNEFLLQSIRDQVAILQTIRELNVMFYPFRLLESVKEHTAITNQIQAKNFEGIEQLVKVHMLNSIKAYSIALDQ